MSDQFEWVDSDQRLAELATQWQAKDAIALDTEFIRSRTFFPKIGLLQVADNEGVYLIDPLAIVEVQEVKNVLLNPSVTKVIHSCSEDLEVFQHYLSSLPTPLFDTQIAAAFAGHGSSIGYANLIQLMEDKTIPKQETRSDWLQRPLSQAQLNYAALDVKFLLGIYQKLQAQLKSQQRLAWLESDCEQMLEKYQANAEYEQYYRRLKSAWKLKPDQLSVLRKLCAWREQEARAIDIPRNHLIKDASLLDISRTMPSDKKALKRVRDISNAFVETYDQTCLQLVQQALEDSENYPEPLPPPFGPEQRNLFKKLKAKVVSIAEALNIPPEFLARKNDLEKLVRQQGSIVKESTSTMLPLALQGWRSDIVGQALLECILKEEK
jgi:ribonuclease D